MFERCAILVPTGFEAGILREWLPPVARDRIKVTGFGVVQSGIETVRLLRPDSERLELVILAGIAGTYDSERFPPGSAASFRQVAMWGIGAGPESSLILPGEPGLKRMGNSDEAPVATVLPLRALPTGPVGEMLLTVAAAAGTDEQVAVRRRRFPDSAGEDMEGFAVALAAQACGIPLTIVRGISNEAGDRNHSRWQIHKALEATARLLIEAENGG